MHLSKKQSQQPCQQLMVHNFASRITVPNRRHTGMFTGSLRVATGWCCPLGSVHAVYAAPCTINSANSNTAYPGLFQSPIRMLPGPRNLPLDYAAVPTAGHSTSDLAAACTTQQAVNAPHITMIS